MVTIRLPQIVSFLCCLLYIIIVQANAAPKCDCQLSEEINKTASHLRLVTRISALKLLPTVRELIYHSEAEKRYFLQRAKYDTLKNLRTEYGNLLAQTHIARNMDVLVVSIEKLLSDNRSLTRKEIQSSVNSSLIQFHTNVLPSAFLCFALGTCRIASVTYMECMRNNVQQWATFFSDEPLKLSQSIADTVWRYRNVEAILQVLHNSLITAEEEITTQCAHRFHNVTVCPKCLTDDSVGYCRDSCQLASFSCFEKLASRWETKTDELFALTRTYDEGFDQLVQGIVNGVRELVEVKAPKLARIIVSSCGPLLKESSASLPFIFGSRPQKPKEVKPVTKELSENMRTLRRCWMQIARRTCSDASESEFCWNGTNIVKLQSADELSLGIKDVRPRPKESWLESSGQPYDTDDEDFIPAVAEGSGSGLPSASIDDIEDTTMYTIAPAVTTPTPATTTPSKIEDVVHYNISQLVPSLSSWTAAVLTILVTLLLSQ